MEHKKISRGAVAQLSRCTFKRNWTDVQMKFEHLADEQINSRTFDQIRDKQTYRRFVQVCWWAENIWTYWMSTFINKGADDHWSGEHLNRMADEQMYSWTDEQMSRWADEQMSRWTPFSQIQERINLFVQLSQGRCIHGEDIYKGPKLHWRTWPDSSTVHC